MINATASRQAGWRYSQTGEPCAYIVPLDNPDSAMLIPCDSWWQALRFSLSYAENNGCEFVGGPR